jgi:Ca2+-dependent lipid-binding protein
MVLKDAVLLTPADSNGLADPYVKLKQKGEKIFKSKVIKKTLKPAWNEKFSVDLHSEGGKISVRVEVWDQDAMTSKFMCSGDMIVEVQPDGKILFPTEIKVQLKTKAGKDDGAVTFNFV